MRRVSYHQSVCDLLDLQPQESPQAREMIEACEARSGRRLPESVRQWYLVDGVVALQEGPGWLTEGEEGRLWYDYSNMDHPEPLEVVLRQFAHEREGGPPWWADDRLWVLGENQGCCCWFIQLDGSDDPPVFVDPDYDHRLEGPKSAPPPEKVADRFSEFLFDWVARFYFEDWSPLSERSPHPQQRTRPPREKPHLDGLWLHAPHAEALAPPYLDYLIENVAEGSRQEIISGVMQHRFHDAHGSVRVTTDDCREEGGVSAWWLHAPSLEDLFHLARKAWWCCDLPATLRHWSEVASPVMDRLRESERS